MSALDTVVWLASSTIQSDENRAAIRPKLVTLDIIQPGLDLQWGINRDLLHCSDVRRIDAIRGVEQADCRGLLDELVEDIVDDQFQIGEKPINSVS